ncbi:hypothetical protein DMN91_011419 [Ooceraea biroi]|uniref:Major facilitator superfamily domain-containing protein n=1 Tax=Ooceraea biroi TaxID=2015173 RepID=A0A3L8D5D7_OOCBI|nr:major facilitator superfamily domain-containing protein 12 isoform X1 [Ooceraea biroi]XP_019889402.1 major facilitator superfamily domain-containing protein 12 isoform X1 [Ooceraea biroi]XP_026829961.1 major facilitator superfamily domain-containing protein 12 isoform X1 [Ooceraea biroi]RLU15665.1 hypothetical protein DMN91_011419 [Ooceraea biroi]
MDNVNEQTSLVDRGRVAMSTKLAYALGHIFNDLAAAMWFSYTLIYLQRVASLEPIIAGSFLLLGQVIDAIMTPVFGFLVDRYCKKKIWHVIGSIMVTFSFPVIFGGFAKSSSGIVMLLYVTSITIFQTGWAAVQISHLSMIPSLTNSLLARADLTAIRYSAQVGAAVVVFLVTWIVLPTSGESIVQLDQQDDYKFRNIVLILTTLGLTATVFFHIFLKANLLEQTPHWDEGKRDEEVAESSEHSFNRRLSWLGITVLLRVAMLYVASRLFITLATVYLPLYIEESKVGGKQALASVPLVSYVSSFVAALLLKHINRACGLLFPGRCNRHPGRRRYGVDRKQHDSRVRYRCVNRRGKFHHDGHRVKRHRGTNRLEDGTQRTRVLYRYFSRQDHHRPRGDINREMEMQRPGTLSELQPRRTVRRVRFLDDTGTRNFAVCIALPDMTRFTFSALCNNHVIYSLIKNCRQSNKHISFPLCMLLLFIPFFFPVRSKCTIDLFSFFFY